MRHAAFVVLVALVASGCSPMVYTHGVPNLAQVSPSVYRSGQIETDEGLRYIQALAGARHVHIVKLNFANEGSDAAATAMGFTVHELPINPQGDQDLWDDLEATFRGPDPVRVNEAELVLAHCDAHADTELCLVHCTHGQDRTGYLVGRYRVHHGWTKARAYAEMLEHHFHAELHGVHEAWEAFTP